MGTRALSVRSAVTRGIPAWGAAVMGVALFALLACGGEPPSPATPQVGAPAAERFPPTFSGTYRVEGVTTVEATGGQREAGVVGRWGWGAPHVQILAASCR